MHSTPRDASDPRHDYTLDIHYSRRLTMCGHVRWKGAVNYQHVVPKGTWCVLLRFAKRPPNTLQVPSIRSVGGWRRQVAFPYRCGRLHRESCCLSRTRFQRSSGPSCQPSSHASRIAICSRSFTHACCDGDFPLSFQRNLRFAFEEFLG